MANDPGQAAPPSLRVVAVRGKGRGVVAGRHLTEDEVIQRDPVVVIPADDWPHIEATVLVNYCFGWHEGRDDAAIALGPGSMLNHSYTPNASARTCLRERVIEFVALRDIDEGEEVTINYNPETDPRRPLHFRVR